MIGRAISHYRVLSALGSGGMGVVYLAEDERLGRQVALKFLPQESLKNRQALDRFRVEARAASSLSHPGICAIYDIGEDDGMPFIVMEALRGENLRDRINKGPLKVGDLVDIGIQLADALEAAHNQGIIHRDIKPSNIFVGDKNRVKILDFGLAKLSTAPGSGSGVDASTHQTVVKQLTMPGSALGTVSYMSPEQARGEDVDTRTDLFSLGAVIYEMATGTQAFGGSTHAVVFDAILNHTPPVLLNLNPLVPQRLEEIINTLLEKDRELRCQHASDLQAELKRLRRDLDSGTMMSAVGASRAGVSGASPARTSASRQPSAPAIPPPAPARSLWPYAVTVLSLLIVAAVGFTIWSGRQQVPATVTPQPATGATTPATPKPLPTTPVPEVGDRAALAAEAAQTTPPSPPTRGAAPPNQTDAPRGATSARPGIETRPPAPAGRGAPAVSPPVTISPPPVTPAPQTAAQTPAPAPTPTPPPAPQAQAPPPPAAAEPPATPPPQAQPAAPARAAETTPPPQPTPRAPAAPDIPPASPVESDDTLIRRVVATYKNAIETKNVALFRSVRPGLSAAEEARLRESFRQLDSQQITIGIDELRVEGKTAFARISRQDVIMSGGRRQTQSIRQTLRFEKSGANWIITAIGN